jgi:mannose-6-phosphate isomerase
MSTTGQGRQLAPFRIAPHFDPRVWGYKDLRPWFDCVVKEGEALIGEVWLTGDMCKAATGALAGQTLKDIFSAEHEALLGAGAPSPDSPLLLKVLFAQQKLSVQVHPDDKMAQKYGDPRGKTECWYALAASDDAKVALGLKPGATIAQVKQGIEDGTLEESLNLVKVDAGDMIFVDAGTVHAIWPGPILMETQQNCDLTYRMYDYGRPRELHVEKSLEATKLQTRAGKVPAQTLRDRTILIDVEYFRVERMVVDGSRSSESLAGADRKTPGLSYLFAAAGAGRIAGEGFEVVELPARGIVAVPANAPAFVVEDRGGLDLMRISPNWPGAAR